MFYLLLVLFITFGVLVITEYLSRKKNLSIEVSRKIPHIVGGLAMATWPFFVEMRIVAVLSLLLTLATIIVVKFNLFPYVRAVDRLSWGEPFFGLGISIAALLGPSKWVFAAAILHLALADAAAALIGKKYGKHSYKLFRHKKSIEGGLAFTVVSALITAWLVFVAPAGLRDMWPVVIWLPFFAAFIEGVTPFGLDNLLLPILIVMIFMIK